MKFKILKKSLSKLYIFFRYIMWWSIRGFIQNESVYFYTFHKCASSFFASYVLKNAIGLWHVDYAAAFRSSPKEINVNFKGTGYLYGPIRLSVDPSTRVWENLVSPLSKPEFICDKTAVFLVRDPRDILVSGYYSYGFTHSYSPIFLAQKKQKELKNKIRNMGIDQYALTTVEEIKKHFDMVETLHDSCERSVILRYEDMISHFDTFINELKKYIRLSESTIKKMYEDSRPKQKVDNCSHRRSGKHGQFRKDLQKDTIQILNQKLENILIQYQYFDDALDREN